MPALVACAHGTRDPAGQEAIDALRTAIAASLTDVRVVEAYVDVQAPSLTEALRRVGRAIVVPLLLSSGYHANVDIAEAVAAAGSVVVKARTLGPDPALVDVLTQRLDEAGLTNEHAVVLGAAGSSDARATRDVEQTAGELSRRIGRDVVAGYGSAAAPRIDEAVAGVTADGRPVAVASYLLARGFFYDRLQRVAADVHTAPLLPHPAINDLVLRRYDEALRGA